MLLSAEHKGILSILSGKKHGLVSFLTPWSSMAMGLPGLAILWVCPLLWRGRCLNWRVQAALLLGHLEQKLFLNIAQKKELKFERFTQNTATFSKIECNYYCPHNGILSLLINSNIFIWLEVMLLMTKYSNEVSFIDLVNIQIQLNNFKCCRFFG